MSRQSLKISGVALLLMGLMSCTPDEGRPIRWLGRNADEFFRTFGPSKSEEQLPGGRKQYLWENRSSWRAITGQIPMLCRAFVVTTPDNIIIEFIPVSSRLSRCAEKFEGQT
jgi:hypothetical protein